MPKIGVVSDIHLRLNLPYSDLVPDKREAEAEETLQAITRAFDGCDAVVILGDAFHSRSGNAPSVIARFVRLLESFGDRQLFLVAGNHDLNADGTSSLDFLTELKGKPKWKVIKEAPDLCSYDGLELCFQPYMHRAMSKAKDQAGWKEAMHRFLKLIPKADILFTHHAISGCGTDKWDDGEFGEPLMDRELLLSKFRMTVAGHVHGPGDYGNIHVVGSVFNSEVGEMGKSVAVIDAGAMTFTRVQLPGRHVVRLTDPKPEDVPATEAEHGKSAILKLVVTDGRGETEMAAFKEAFKGFDGVMVVEKPSGQREKAHVETGIEDLSMERLIAMWSEARKSDPEPLLRAWAMLKV